jgi:hypothetical protein
MCGAIYLESGNNAPERLTNEEAYKLISAVGRGNSYKYKGRYVGEKFRQSVKYFSVTEPGRDWTPPPQRYRLDIDDVIEKLLSRNSTPMISRMDGENSSPLRLWGPFSLARDHLSFFAVWQSDPAFDENRNLGLQSLANDLKRAKESLDRLLNRDSLSYYFIPSKTLKSIGDDGFYWSIFSEKVDHALNTFGAVAQDISDLSNIVETELEVVSQTKQVTGRPRETWKAEFVSSVAGLWQLLTKEEASGSPDSLFGEFVQAAWRSYDDNVPDISFDRAIRERKQT